MIFPEHLTLIALSALDILSRPRLRAILGLVSGLLAVATEIVVHSFLWTVASAVSDLAAVDTLDLDLIHTLLSFLLAELRGVTEF
jgi:uncharacterized membrane protein YkgB